MNLKQETFYKVKYYDLEDQIKQIYGKEFSIPADLEASNDSSHEFDIDGKLDQHDKEDIDKWIKTGASCFLTRNLMNDLCAKGHLPPGKYLIVISW